MKRRNRQHHGFSLVVCLIILTLLSILVVSFITTTTIERNTSRAFLNKANAEMAADTAVNQAISLLSEKVAQYPDSVTAWDKFTPPGASNPPDPDPNSGKVGDVEGTVLYINSTPAAPNSLRKFLPLFSRSEGGQGSFDPVLIDQRAQAMGIEAWTNDNSIDLNRPRFNNDTEGWMGSLPVRNAPAGTFARRPFRAKWIEIKDRAALPAGATPVPGEPTARTIARYAYWIEDESFKVNLNQVGATVRGRELVSPGMEVAEIPVQGLVRAASPAAHDPAQRDLLAQDTLALRDGWFGKKLFDLRSFNHADDRNRDGQPYNLGDKTRSLATIHSGALNLSRQGSQRVNLNKVVGVDILDVDQPRVWENYQKTSGEVTKQVRQIVETMSFHGGADYKFGERFFRLLRPGLAGYAINAEQVTKAHREIYLYKIAANIRDYIDPDIQPTIVLSPLGGNFFYEDSTSEKGRVDRPRDVRSAINADFPNAIWAQGKEGGPYLQEANVRYRTDVNAATRRYSLKVDYYIEFWNMGNKDIYVAPNPAISEPHALGEDTFLRISNQMAWKGNPGGAQLRADNAPLGDPEEAPERDLKIDLRSGVFLRQNNRDVLQPFGVVFKAGACTVITTDPDYWGTFTSTGDHPYLGGYNVTNVYYCSHLLPNRAGVGIPPSKREFTGPLPGSSTGIKPDFRYVATSTPQDYDTEVILANSKGIIDSHPCAVAHGANIIPVTLGGLPPRELWFGGTLWGNASSAPTPSQLGDPRTNNEQLSYFPFAGVSTGEPDQTRYWNASQSGPRFNLGYPNDYFMVPHAGTYPWPDYYKGWTKTSNGTAKNPRDLPGAINSTTGYVENSASTVYNGRLNSAGKYDPKLASIGLLGDVYDPARVVGDRGSLGLEASRGGGRSLRIGQKDKDIVDMSTPGAASQQWASWRLADFFTTQSDVFQPGLININGLRRDNGVALRAACEGMIQRTVIHGNSSNPTVTEKALETAEAIKPGLQSLIDEVITRLEKNAVDEPSYFRERGELSELNVFSTNPSSGELLSGARMSEAFDHTREEFVRRLIDLTTTRGSIFSVYVVGQSVTEGRDPQKTLHVTGEHWKKVTFALLPRKADNSAFGVSVETFDPTKTEELNKRFAKPDHYDIQVLQVSSP